MKPITESIKLKIASAKKNGLDISDLIKDINIRGLDLSYAKIKDFSRPNDNISRCNLAYAKIGQEGKITNLCGANLTNCNFYKTTFIGVTWFRRTIAVNCNFTGCDLSKLDYAYCDFRKSTFCHSIIKIGSWEGIKAKFSKGFFDELLRFWEVEDMPEKSEEALLKVIESEGKKNENI